ncbi:VanZ family protein [Pediococcus siamensis]|uniref:VanZ family protein n=1 Tax=Pediococcus siamensis TaxID=381829 RepID=UPI0039A0E162
MSLISYLPFVILSSLVALYNLQKLRVNHSPFAILVRVSFIIYVVSVFYLIFTPGTYSFGMDILPQTLHVGYAKVVVTPYHDYSMQAILNVIMTIPAGVYLYIFGFRDRPILLEVLVIALGIALFNEGGQFVLDQLIHINRTVDIMDVIHNGLGVVLGFYIMTPFNLLLKTEEKSLQNGKF